MKLTCLLDQLDKYKQRYCLIQQTRDDAQLRRIAKHGMLSPRMKWPDSLPRLYCGTQATVSATGWHPSWHKQISDGACSAPTNPPTHVALLKNMRYVYCAKGLLMERRYFSSPSYGVRYCRHVCGRLNNRRAATHMTSIAVLHVAFLDVGNTLLGKPLSGPLVIQNCVQASAFTDTRMLFDAAGRPTHAQHGLFATGTPLLSHTPK